MKSLRDSLPLKETRELQLPIRQRIFQNVEFFQTGQNEEFCGFYRTPSRVSSDSAAVSISSPNMYRIQFAFFGNLLWRLVSAIHQETNLLNLSIDHQKRLRRVRQNLSSICNDAWDLNLCRFFSCTRSCPRFIHFYAVLLDKSLFSFTDGDCYRTSCGENGMTQKPK